MKVAIIGAGISGVSLAKMLNEKMHEVVIYEKETNPGGLVRCDFIQGNLIHRVGGHVFNAKNKEVFNWFWNHFDQENEFIKADRNAKILLDGKMIGYPIENYIYKLDTGTIEKVVKEFLSLPMNGYVDPFAYANFEQFLRGNFGDTLYDLYFKPYNEKIWQIDLGSVPMHWLEGKLPMPDVSKILLNNITRDGEREMVHSTFYYPKRGGSQFIIDRLAQGLEIRCSDPVSQLRYVGRQWEINGSELFDALVYTGDIRKLRDMISPDSVSEEAFSLLKSFSRFRANGTSNALCFTDPTDLSWLYLPDSSTRAHRIIYTGNFSPYNNDSDDRPTCVVEFSGRVSADEMNSEISKLPGSLKPIAVNYEPNSYVIQDFDTRTEISKFKELTVGQNLFLCGRFAEWEYYNMDKAIEAGLKLAKVLSLQNK